MTEQAIPEKKADNFEDGKELEEYVNELDKLNIEPEPSPEATARIESVAEAPIRNKDQKKEKTKSQEPPKPVAPAKQASPAIAYSQSTNDPPQSPPNPAVTQQNPMLAQPNATTAVTQNNPQPKPTEQPVPQEQPKQPQQLQFNSIDDYLKYNANEIKKQYSQQGDVASQQYLNEAYKRLVAVVKVKLFLSQ